MRDDCHHCIDKRIPFIPGEPHESVLCDWCAGDVCIRCGLGLSLSNRNQSTYIYGICTQTQAMIDNMRAQEVEGRGRVYQDCPRCGTSGCPGDGCKFVLNEAETEPFTNHAFLRRR